MDIQIIIIELHLRKEKWLVVLVYKPPAQDTTYLLYWLSQIIDFYSITYEKQVVIGDFYLTPDNKSMREFVDLYNLIDLIETTTCFKGTESCIDLLLTNQKYSFKNTKAFETGLSDHYLLIYSMLKTSFQKNKPKRLIYRDYTSFSKDSFLTDLSNSIENSQCYETFETKAVEVLDKHAPRKTKLLRENHKPHVSKKLRKEIMKRPQLKNIENKSGKDIDLYKLRKQRNLVVNLNKKRGKEFSKFFVYRK